MIEFLEWLFKTHPELATAIVCLGSFLFVGFMGIKKGLVSFGRPKRIPGASSTPKSESGRLRALQVLDNIEREELEMPPSWQEWVEGRVIHKWGNLTQEKVYPLIEQDRARLARLEPVVAELKLASDETHDSVVRLEEGLKGVKEVQGEIKDAIKTMRDEVLVAIAKGARG